MTTYLVSFPSVAMDVPEGEDVQPVPVAGVGTMADASYQETAGLTGGFTLVDVPSRTAALEWAAKIAVACRCAQEVRAFMVDPLG